MRKAADEMEVFSHFYIVPYLCADFAEFEIWL